MRRLSKRQVTLYQNHIKKLKSKNEFHKLFELTEQLFQFINIIKEATIISSAYYQSLIDKDLLQQQILRQEIERNIDKYFISFEVDILNKENTLWYYKLEEVTKEGVKHTRVKTRTNAKTTLRMIQHILYLENSEKYKDLIIEINSYINPRIDLNNSLPNIVLPIKFREKKEKVVKQKKLSKKEKRQMKKRSKGDIEDYYLEIRSSDIYCYVPKYPMLKLSKREIKYRKKILLEKKRS